MRPDDPQDYFHKRPFQPFRVTLTDGRTYEVHHPELAMVGRSMVAIGLPRASDPRPVPAYDHLVTVSLLHIMQIEPIVPAPTP